MSNMIKNRIDVHVRHNSDRQTGQTYYPDEYENRNECNAQFTDDDPMSYSEIVDYISVPWQLVNQLYDDLVHAQDTEGNGNVHCNDGDVEPLDISSETWKYTQTCSAKSAQPTEISVKT